MNRLAETIRHWGALIGILMGMAIIGMNFSIVNISLSSIQKDLSSSVLQLQWMVNIFGVFISCSLLLMGYLGDRFGHRRIFLIGMLGLIISSLGAGLAPNSNWIIASQAIMGISAAIILPISQILIRREFPDHQMGKAIGIWAGGIGIMLGIGPLVGGLILNNWSWHWIFLINLPIALAGFILVLCFVRKFSTISHKKTGWWKTLHSIICNKTFLLPSIGVFCLNFYIWAIFFLFPLYLQNVRGDSALRTGCFMLLATGPVVLFGPKIGKMCSKNHYHIYMLIGFLFLIVSSLIQVNFHAFTNLWLVATGCLSFGIGWMFSYGTSSSAALGSFPKKLEGTAAGVFTTILEIGGTVGLAVTGTIFRLRGTQSFMKGYEGAIWALLAVSLIGVIITFLMKTKKRFP